MAEINGLSPDMYLRDNYWGAKRSSVPEGRLVFLTDFEWSEPDYSFDTQQFWTDTETGLVYTAHDSGCSCPSPFEDFQVSDLEPVPNMQAFYDMRPEEGFKGWRDEPLPYLEDRYEAARKALQAHFDAQKQAVAA
jgi:hypothetical protein